jgi:hypothetical protein
MTRSSTRSPRSSIASAVPSAAHDPLLAIAATSQPTWDLVLEIAGPEPEALNALRRGVEARIIERAGGRVCFTHPCSARRST